MPPVVLAPEARAEGACGGHRAGSSLDGLGPLRRRGRAVTDRGNLKLADGKELRRVLGTDDRFDEQIGDRVFKTKSSEELSDVDWTYRIALEALMLETEGTKLLPGANAGWVDAPLDAVYGALLVMLQAHRPGPAPLPQGPLRLGLVRRRARHTAHTAAARAVPRPRAARGRRSGRDDVERPAGRSTTCRTSRPTSSPTTAAWSRTRCDSIRSARRARDRRDRRRDPHAHQVRRCRAQWRDGAARPARPVGDSADGVEADGRPDRRSPT